MLRSRKHSAIPNQHGIFTTELLLAQGYSRDQIYRLSKRWQRVSEGIYLDGEPSFHAATVAGLHRGGPDSALGENAAAWCWGLIPDAPHEITIWAPGPRDPFMVGKWALSFRRAARPSRGTPRRTTVEETILDVANISDEVGAVACLCAGLSQSMTTGERMLRQMSQRKRQRHRSVLKELCARESMRGIDSALEYLFHRNVVEAHGLPLPSRQQPRAGGRVDNLYEEYFLIAEVDGERYHDRKRDHHRDNEHILAHDERTLRFGWSHCNAGACTSAQQLHRGLRKGGWDGKLRRRSCRCITV